MGQHKVVRGETGTYTHKTGKTETYDGKHRDGTAQGTETQRKALTTKSDIPHRDGRTD